MGQALPPKNYNDFLGVDLTAPYRKRAPESAERFKNGFYLRSGSASCRPGRKYSAINLGGLGYLEYIRPASDGSTSKSKITISDLPYEVTSGTFDIEYSGAATNVIVQHLVDSTTNTWVFQVVEDDVEVLSHDCGAGIDEAGPETLADLLAAIEGISGDYAVTITGDDTTPAAFLPTLVSQALTGGPLAISIDFLYTVEIRTPDGSTAPFSLHYADRNAATFSNATGLNHHNVLLVATRRDTLRKIDGNMCYNAGMAVSGFVSATPAGAGAITATWGYKTRYRHQDAQGNLIYGTLSDLISASPSADASVDLVNSNLRPTSGYATDQAKVNGNQAGVNIITVDAGHKIQAGDVVTLLNRAVSARDVVTRTVTSIAATTVTIDGGTVDVSDNDIISHGLVIEYYRTKDQGSFLYLLAVIPNDSSAATQTYVDSVADASLGDLLIEPSRNPDPPPKGGIVVAHQGLVCLSGNLSSPNSLWKSEPAYPEGFPEDLNEIEVFSQKGGSIVALWPSGAGLDVFFESSIYRILGTILDEAFELQKISLANGCVSQHAIVEIDQGPLVFVSKTGFRQMVPGGFPLPIGEELDPLFNETRANPWTLARAVAADNAVDHMAYFFLPVETDQGGEIYSDDTSEVWVLDYQIKDRPRWVGPWQVLNMAGGVIVQDGETTFIERRYSTQSSTVVRDLSSFIRRSDEFSQVDHTIAIDWEWIPGWEDGGDNTIAKIFEYLRLESSDLQRSTGFTLNVTIEKNDQSGLSSAEFIMEVGVGGGDAGWWFEPWGFFPWGSPSPGYAEVKIPNNTGFSMRPVFEHETIYERPIITQYSLAIRASFKPGLRR